jgi:hypothetical protein
VLCCVVLLCYIILYHIKYHIIYYIIIHIYINIYIIIYKCKWDPIRIGDFALHVPAFEVFVKWPDDGRYDRNK